MTEAVQIALIVAAGPTLLAIGTLIVQLKTAWAAAAKVEEVAIKAEEVNTALVQSNKQTTKTLDKIHTLVNNNMGIQLRLNAANARFKAVITHDDADIEAANLAEQMLQEHEGKQAIVDSQK